MKSVAIRKRRVMLMLARKCWMFVIGVLVSTGSGSYLELPRTVAASYQSGSTDCTIRAAGITNSYSIASLFVLPGERVSIKLDGRYRNSEHSLEMADGVVLIKPNQWNWRAPAQPGLYTGKLYHAHSNTVTILNIFVMVPFRQARSGSLNGYRIGRYPAPPAARVSSYKLPRGFIEVTADLEHTYISPHFNLHQFLCKQRSGYPKYVVIHPLMPQALETILDHVNRRGFEASTLFVMSGYRTPVYNRSIGNVAHSRHVYGDAADIFVDSNPIDGFMDDLNGDGQINCADNDVLLKIIEQALYTAGPRFLGGVSKYSSNEFHGPFVHMDLRGYKARW